MFDLQKLKRDSLSEALKYSIPVYDSLGVEIAKLVPVGSWALDSSDLLIEFASWRRIFKRFFLTQSEYSEESTKQFLKNFSIKQRNRILFGIYIEDYFIGHIGLANVADGVAEIDNLIRGKSGGNKDLIYFVEKTLLFWAFENLGLTKIVGKMLSNNVMARTLHERCGFKRKEIRHLKKTLNESSTTLDVCEPIEANVNYHLEIIELDRHSFYASWKASGSRPL